MGEPLGAHQALNRIRFSVGPLVIGDLDLLVEPLRADAARRPNEGEDYV